MLSLPILQKDMDEILVFIFITIGLPLIICTVFRWRKWCVWLYKSSCLLLDMFFVALIYGFSTVYISFEGMLNTELHPWERVQGCLIFAIIVSVFFYIGSQIAFLITRSKYYNRRQRGRILIIEGALYLLICGAGCLLCYSDIVSRYKGFAENEVVYKIKTYQEITGHLPQSLSEIGIDDSVSVDNYKYRDRYFIYTNHADQFTLESDKCDIDSVLRYKVTYKSRNEAWTVQMLIDQP